MGQRPKRCLVLGASETFLTHVRQAVPADHALVVRPNSLSALEALESTRPSFCITGLHAENPEDGAQFLRWLGSRHRKPVIICSSRHLEGESEAAKNPAFVFIPFDDDHLSQLQQMVQKLVG